MDPPCSSGQPVDLYSLPFRQLDQSLPCEPPPRQLPTCTSPIRERSAALGAHFQACSCNFSSSTQHPGDRNHTNMHADLRHTAPFDVKNNFPSFFTNNRSQALHPATEISGRATSGGRLCEILSSHSALRQCSQSSVADCTPKHQHPPEQTYGSKYSHILRTESESPFSHDSNDRISGDAGCRPCGPNSPKLDKKITIYKWCLLRPGGGLSSEVAIGGYLTLGAIHNEKVVTAPIVERLEKCRLLTKDGTEVRLMGLIDDCTTVSNGFFPKIVDMFLSGFPYIWKFLVGNEFPVRSNINAEGRVSGSSDLNSGEAISKPSSERGTNHDKNAQQQHPASCEEELMVSLDPIETVTVLKSAVKKDPAVLALPKDQDHAVLDQETQITHPQEDKCEVEATVVQKEQLSSACPVSENIEFHESPKTINQVFDAENLSVQEMGKSEHGAVDILDIQIVSDGTRNSSTHQQRETGAELLGDIVASDKRDCSKGKLGKTQKAKHTTEKVQMASYLTRSASRTGRSLESKQINLDNILPESAACMASDNLASQNTEAEDYPAQVGGQVGALDSSNEQTVEVGTTESVTEELKESGALSVRTDVVPCQTDELEINMGPSPKGDRAGQDVQVVPHYTRSKYRGCKYLEKTQNWTVDQTIKLAIPAETNEDSQFEKMEAEDKCLNANNMSDQNFDERITAAHKRCREPHLTRSRSRANKNLVKTQVEVCNAVQEKEYNYENKKVLKGKTSLKKEGDRLGSIKCAVDVVKHEQERKRLKLAANDKDMHISSKNWMLPPPLPRPRVTVSTRIITTAFGLKTSRSGRLLVPPLAHWRNETLVRDVDGGIIAILDGGEDSNEVDTGYCNFKFPVAAEARKLQKQLCAAAIESRSNEKRTRKKNQ